MAEALLPLFAIAAGLMLVAGLAKLRSPAGTQRALAAFGLPPSAALARASGAVEVGIAALCLLAPGRVAAIALAAAYLALTVLSALWSRGEREAPCGCFGEASTPIHPGHLALNLLFALVAAAAVLVPPASLAALPGASPAPALVLIAGIGCAVYLVLSLLTLLPAAWGAYGGGDG